MGDGFRSSGLEPVNSRVKIAKDKPFKDADGFRARFKGFEFTATKNTATPHDIELIEERWIDGLLLVLKNHKFGDSISLQIVDKNGIFGPANQVLDDFGETWYMAEDTQAQPMLKVQFPARLYQGLFIRLTYNSVGAETDVEVKVNFRLYKKDV